MKNPSKTRKPMTIAEMADEVYSRGSGASGPELSDLVTQIMKANGYDPQDAVIRREIGEEFRSLYRRAS